MSSNFDNVPSITKTNYSEKENSLSFEIRISSPKLSVGGSLSAEAKARIRLTFLTYVQSLCDAEAAGLRECLGDD